MPISLDPNATLEIEIVQDGEPKPVLICRFLSCRDVMEVDRLYADATTGGKSTEEQNTIINQAIRVIVTGWKNVIDRDGQAVPFNDEGMNRAFTPMEKILMVKLLPNEIATSELEKKAFALRARTTAGGSATPAREANAKNSPAPEPALIG